MGGEGRYHPRNRELPVQEIPKNERKRHPVFDGRWTEKFAFMRLPGFPLHSLRGSFFGKEDDRAVVKLPSERSQVPFLVSREALERCSIWGKFLPYLLFLVNSFWSRISPMLQVICQDPKYKKAFEVMSAMKAAPKRAAPSETEDEVQFIRSSKRHATTQASSSKKKSKASGSTSKVSPSSSSSPTTVLDNLNTKVFPLNPVSLPEDSLETIQSVQSDLLQIALVQAMSQLFHLGEKMDDHGSLKADIAALTYQLLRNQDEAGTLAASENVSLREQLECQEEEVCDLRCAAETFDVEKAMAVTGGRVVTRWELMRECLNHQTDSWDLEVALEQYKMVKTSEAELQGLSVPSFEGVLMIPCKNEAEKTPEPTADDPPIDCVGEKYSMKRLLQLPGSCSRFRVPAPASGSCLRDLCEYCGNRNSHCRFTFKLGN
ncbi:hypothetical protein YC2023_050882 [Brassica napus]